jgi:hypothetical protein
MPPCTVSPLEVCMALLAYMGLPPALAINLMIWMAQMKAMTIIVTARYLQAIEREQYLRLPPGEQYRRHVMAGGYRP